jgi:hypothetical protein
LYRVGRLDRHEGNVGFAEYGCAHGECELHAVVYGYRR